MGNDGTADAAAERIAALEATVAELRRRLARAEGPAPRLRADSADLTTIEQRHRTLAEATGAIVWSSPPSGLHVVPPLAWMAFTGQSAQDALGAGWAEAVHPDDRQEAGERWAAAVASGQPLRHEYRVRRHDGEWRWMSVDAAPIRGPDGAIVEWFGVNVDVTEQRMAAAQVDAALGRLRRTESALRLIVDNAPAGIALFDREMRYLAVSRRFLADYGLPADEDVIGRRHYDLFPDLPEHWRAFHQRVLAGESLSEEEEEYRVAGRTEWVRWTMVPWRTASGEVGGMLIGAEIRTEQVEARRALVASEARFRQTANQTPSVLWVTDERGANEFVNDAWSAFFGLSLEQVQRIGWEPLLHPDDVGFIEVFGEATRDQRPFSVRVRMRRADGAWRDMAIEGRPRVDDQGTFLGMIGVSTDVTDELRAVERERESARQKDEFIAVLAHELRNPLAPIRAAVGVLRGAAAGDPSVARCREIIDRQVTQLARLLDDLLDVSRLSRDTLSLRRERVTLASVIELAVETARPAIEERRHQLTVHVGGEVDADRARLAQVFVNLLHNAAMYTEPGGAITVTSRRVPGEERVAVEVRDTGVGVPPELRERIFEMFTQADRAGTRAAGGLGIGLALARRLLEKHGGTIRVESDGRGSTFTVELPLAGPEVRARVASVAPTPAVTSRPRVLVVDDNVDAADMVAMLLEPLECDTAVAYDGRAALALAEETPPDVVLLDLGMPELDGYAVCAELRARFGPAVSVVALTGWGQPADLRRTEEAGFDRHLVKPVDPDVLVDLVRRTAATRT